MPVITGPITRDGAVIGVLVGVSENRRSRLLSAGFPVPEPIGVRAVIDTGSFATGFRPGIFAALGIQPFRNIPLLTPSTRPDAPHITDQYDVSLSLISGDTRHDLPSVFAIASDDFEEHGIEALIGRDVLDYCVLSYFGREGRFELAF